MVAVIRSSRSRKSSAASAASSPKAQSRSAASSPTAMARKLSVIGSKSPMAAASAAASAGKNKVVTKARADKPLRRAAKSAPASPQQQPSVIPPVEIPIDSIQQQPQADPQPAVQEPEVPSPAPSASSMDDAPAAESEPVYTAEEQKMLATLQSVRDRLTAIEAGLPTLRGQIGYHLARLALLRGTHYRSPTLNAAKLHLSHSSLRYHAGLIDEQTMQAIFRLDSIQTDNEHIRRERKATVARGNRIIGESVELVKRMDKIARFLPPKEEIKEETSEEKQQQPATEENMSDVSDDEEEKEQPIPQQKQKQPDVEMRSASPAAAAPVSPSRAGFAPGRQLPPRPASRATPPPPAAAAPAPAAPSSPTPNPFLRKYASLHLPEWRGPAFHSSVHPLTGSLLIEADLSGVRSEDLQVLADPATRVLTIRGVKLPQRRRSVPAYADFFGTFGAGSVEPHGHFEKRVDFKELDPSAALNLAAMSAVLNADERLEITIPRAPKVAAAPQTARKAPVQQQQPQRPQTARAAPQQQYRPAVQHSSGYGFSDEDDEEEQYVPQQRYAPAYAPHPFYARPQTAPRRPVYAASPFFGGFW